MSDLNGYGDPGADPADEWGRDPAARWDDADQLADARAEHAHDLVRDAVLDARPARKCGRAHPMFAFNGCTCTRSTHLHPDNRHRCQCGTNWNRSAPNAPDAQGVTA